MEINWKRVFRYTVVEIIIITIAFSGWYYFVVKIPQEERIKRNVERNIEMNQQIMEAEKNKREELEEENNQ